MVYEISTDGEVLHLKDIGPPKTPAAPAPAEIQKDVEESTPATDGMTAADEAKKDEAKTADDADDEAILASLPDSLRDLPSHRPQWNHPSTTAALLPILPIESILKLHALVVEGRRPPKPKEEKQAPAATFEPAATSSDAKPDAAVPEGSDNGWAQLAARRKEAEARRAQEEEESMNQLGNEGQDAAVESAAGSRGGRGGRGSQGQGRDRGRGRDRGGRGGSASGSGPGRPEKQVDEREVLSEVSLERLRGMQRTQRGRCPIS